jgi:Fur family transcriptional regulator, ferric uptake regulator
VRGRTPEDVLAGVGLRRTGRRLGLLRALLAAPAPLSPDELFLRARPSGVDRVTVYRTLETFLEAGIVHRIEAGGARRFAVCGRIHRGHCHPHFTCRVCGTVECMTDVALPRLLQGSGGLARLGKQRRAYVVEEQEVYVRGVCARCAAGGTT